MPLDREEYVEQAYFFRALAERMREQNSTQDLLSSIREELLTTAKLPLAVEFMASELKFKGVFAPAMARMGHYFTTFQTFVVEEAEREKGRFDFGVALEILWREAGYRAEGATPQGVFLYQFEVVCRNRLGYDRGLKAMAGDAIFHADWREWLEIVRRQIGLRDICDMIYVRSGNYAKHTEKTTGQPPADLKPALFGEKEGRIALANRGKDPLLLFSALQRHLGYPTVPRPKPVSEDAQQLLPLLARRVERLESRLKLLEEEQKGGIDLKQFYRPPPRGDET